MRPASIALSAVTAVLLAACGTTDGDPAPPSTSEETMASELTVAQATAENDRYVKLITGDSFTAASSFTGQIGCKTNPDSLMSEGPPWKVQTRWVMETPAPEFVGSALARVDDLAAAEGFQSQPWKRPDPPPEAHRSLLDGRGYAISTQSTARPSGKQVFELTVTSPCAEE